MIEWHEAITGTFLGLGLGAGLFGLVACVGELVRAKFGGKEEKEKEFWILDSYGTRLNLGSADEVLDWLPYCRGEVFIMHKDKMVKEEDLWELVEEV